MKKDKMTDMLVRNEETLKTIFDLICYIFFNIVQQTSGYINQ